MNAMKKLILLAIAGMVGLFGWISEADALLTCTNPAQPAGTGWCDLPPADPSTPSPYVNDVLCLAEPVSGSEGSSIDEEVVGAGVCILGKFKTSQDVENLIDFTISYEFASDPLMGPGGIFAPPLEIFAPPADHPNDPPITEFTTVLPLEEDGVYNVSVSATVLGGGGTPQTIAVSRNVLRVGVPHLTVRGIRVGGAEGDVDCMQNPSDPTCIGFTEVDSDGDGICDGPDPVAGICTAGPDPEVNETENGAPHGIQVTPPAGGVSSAQICVNSHDGEASAGTSIVVSAFNTITDSSVSPPKEAHVDSSCADIVEIDCNQFAESGCIEVVESCNEAEGKMKCRLPCSVSTSSFCNGGFPITVPLGHGSNQIDLFVNNLATGYDMGASERITITPFDVDLRGPALCVNYLNDAGTVITGVDNRILLDSEAASVIVDVTLGACGADPEVIEDQAPADCDREEPPVCGSSRVCLQKNGELQSDSPRYLSLCPIETGGKKHYQARFADLRFPINTLTIKAIDDGGNENKETHSFGYGSVRSLFNEQGQFNLREAIIPNGVGGWIPKGFVENELKPLILKVVNSEKFKNDIFPKLLEPRQPGDEEISCLKSIEGEIGCSMDHLASKDRVVTFKIFCDGDCVDNLGAIEISGPYFLNQDRLRIQVRIRGLRGRAEMYTIRFIDSDDDSIVDTEDDDADNDGICDRFVGAVGDCTDADHDDVCDEEKGISGSAGKGLNADRKCILDKSITKGDCPDVDANDEHYWGCSDLDDDNDGVPDDHDLPGRIIPDPDFGTYVMPLQLLVRDVALNLDVRFVKDANGHLRVQMDNAPGMALVEALSDGGNLIDFDCDKDVSEIYQGGRAGETGNGQNLWIDTEACKGFQSLSNGLNGNGGVLQSVVLWLSKGMIHKERRQNEGTNQQLVCTLESMARCSIPKRLEATLDKFEDQKVLATSMELLDNRFHMDFFAPLGSADLTVDAGGIGFKGSGLLLPAGVTDSNDKAERNAVEFLNALPAEFKTPKFGPLSETDEGEAVDPIEAAYGMGSEIDLALKEETVNSLLHAVSVLLFDLDRREPDELKTLDLFTKRLREKFDMGIPDIMEDTICRDKNGQPFDAEADDGGLSTNWKCFPFALSLKNLFGNKLSNYIDFDGDGQMGSAEDSDSQIPVFLRTTLNRFAAPTVRLANVSALEGLGGDGAGRPRMILAEIEVGLPPMRMAVYEEQWAMGQVTDPETGDPVAVRQGQGVIKNGCDSDRFPGMDPQNCGAGKRAPIVVFSATGRVFLTLLIDRGDNGILRIAAGLSSKDGPDGPVLDRDKSFLKVSTVVNNTIVPDQELADVYEENLKVVLEKFLFASPRTIRMRVPAMVPLADFCSRFPGEMQDLCDCVEDPEGEDCEDDIGKKVEDAWDDLNLDDFGIGGFELQDTLIGIAGSGEYSEFPEEAASQYMSGTRYLTVGTGVCVKDEEGRCIGQ